MSNTQRFNIAEIFYSIQGEGFFVGKPALFIRFAGCNLDCSFCDEPTHKLPGKEYTVNQLLKEIKQCEPCRFVVLTGGEPTIHPDFCLLVKILQNEDLFVAVETNGTTRITCNPDWITVSPKTDSFIVGDELKIAYQNQDLQQLERLPFKHFYIQPVNHKKEIDFRNLEKCIKLVKKHPKWKLSLQLHKLLKIK